MYNQDAPHPSLRTQSQPTPSDYIPAVTSTSYDPYGCTPPPLGLATNQTLVVLRGNCTFNDKALLAQSAGARMVVVVYDSSQVAPPSLNDSIIIPVLMLDNDTGQQLLVSGLLCTEAWSVSTALNNHPGHYLNMFVVIVRVTVTCMYLYVHV